MTSSIKSYSEKSSSASYELDYCLAAGLFVVTLLVLLIANVVVTGANG